MSDGEESMSFPFLVTEEDLHETTRCSVTMGENGPELTIEQSTLEI